MRRRCSPAIAGRIAPTPVRLRLSPSALLTVLIAGSTLAGPSPAIAGVGVLEPFGLQGRVVTSLGTFGSLYAGTLGDGVFKRDPWSPSTDWVSLGLYGTRIRAVYPHASGPLGFATTVGIDPAQPDSALIYCLDHDQPPWMVSDSGMVRTEVSAVWSLDGFPSPAICGETFAGTVGRAGGVWMRPYLGPVWKHVLDLGVSVCNVVRVDPGSGNVWAGGETALLQPWIARSTDQGDTWQVVFPNLGGDNACDAIAFHPHDPDIAYAGMEGSVLRTNDGGNTWNATGLDSTQAYMLGLALDSAVPSHVVAGGTIQPNTWALWESIDGGASWVEVAPPLPGTTGISSIVADPSRAGTFYIATFGHGVWKYSRAVTDLPDPPHLPGFALGRIYPNPFTDRTTIEFRIPAALEGANLVLSIHGIDGGLVRELVRRNPGAGTHRITWDGDDARGRRVASGVYIGRLRAGSHVLSSRLVVRR